MRKFDSVIFDLDGTLWDTRAAVAKARNHVVKRLNLETKPFTAEDVGRTMGLPVDQVYEIVFAEVDRSRHQEIRAELQTELERLLLAGEGQLYTGVDQGLRQLAQALPIFIVSNCSIPYLKTFLNWSGLGSLFRDWECFGRTNRPKNENLKALVGKHALVNTIYVGDTRSDQEAAQSANVAYLHVDYGFGHPSDESVTPIKRAADFSEVVNFVFRTR